MKERTFLRGSVNFKAASLKSKRIGAIKTQPNFFSSCSEEHFLFVAGQVYAQQPNSSEKI
jgi:hypothetical protein